MTDHISQVNWTRAFVRLLANGFTIEEAVAALEGTPPFPLDLDQTEARTNHEAWWDK